MLLRFIGKDDGEVYQLTPEDEVAIQEGLAEADRGEFASDESVRAMWAKYGLRSSDILQARLNRSIRLSII